MFETDPKNLQPRIGKVNREIAAWLRGNRPPGLAEARLAAAIEAVEAPCSGRESNRLREVMGRPFESDAAKSRALVEAIEELGLRPFNPPPPLPPIEVDDIHLVCWLAVEAESEADRERRISGEPAASP